jgi:hypothetical protein
VRTHARYDGQAANKNISSHQRSPPAVVIPINQGFRSPGIASVWEKGTRGVPLESNRIQFPAIVSN